MLCRVALFVLAGVVSLSAASGQMPAFDWVQIGDPGNAPYSGTPGNAQDAADYGLIGRGQVNYTYSMARTELTLEQYLPFFNVITRNPNHPVIQGFHSVWGLDNWWTPLGFVPDESYTGTGVQLRLAGPQVANWPVFQMSWRMAAVYCNWLNNGAQNDPATLTSGAYDISTFNNSVNWTDQIAHSPGAQYWIPTLDEWIKAAHYDPDRYGPGQGGYWLYPTSSDTAPRAGLPANGGQYFHQIDSTNPVGMYPGSASPYGLLDMAGGVEEWTETLRQVGGGPIGRAREGGNLTSSTTLRIDIGGGTYPFTTDFRGGLRLASSIPAPASGLLFLLGGIPLISRRNRR